MSTTEEKMVLAPTDKTPAVEIDLDQGSLLISGCSIPENPDRFFSPIQDLVERYASSPQPRTTVRMALSYFNP